jgi:uncharacterized protein
MLLRFAVTNFGAFLERQELSFVASRSYPPGTLGVHEVEIGGKTHHVLSAMATYGANASGKTTVLLALQALSFAVEQSHRSWKPDGDIPGRVRRPHAMASATSPTVFEIECLVEGTRYRYCCGFDRSRVTMEELHCWPKTKKSLIFSRDNSGKVKCARQWSVLSRLSRFLRPNSLLLSVAVQNGVEQLAGFVTWLTRIALAEQDNDSGRRAYAAKRLLEASSQARVAGLLSSADVGVSAVSGVEKAMPENARKILELAMEMEGVSGSASDIGRDYKMRRIVFTHRGRDDREFRLFEGDESKGTVALMQIAFPLFDSIDHGVLLLVDEFEHSLHPHVAAKLLSTFLHAAKVGSQVLFSTHDERLLGLLPQDAVWFTEKSSCGEARLFPLTDFALAGISDVAKAYDRGRFGAVPQLDELLKVNSDG